MNDRANQERFAARMAHLREQTGLSAEAVGAAIGVAGWTVRRWETGQFAPRKKATVAALEKELEARPGELWALLKGYEIPTKPGRPSADTDPRVVELLAREVQEFRVALDELRALIEEDKRPGRNGGPPGSHREASKALAS